MQKNSLDHIALIIPSYKPPEELPDMVLELQSIGFKNIIVINDGSSAEYNNIFDKISKIILIRNPQNLGKGAALKKAYKYVLDHMPSIDCVISCDDDYQHHPNDILKVASQSLPHGKEIILGSRSFSGDVPLKSFIGNVIMRELVALVSGKQIGDTQTGLRCIPRGYLQDVLQVTAEKFNFELITLLHFLKQNYQIKETAISTIYFQNNKSTRFKGSFDSINVIFSLITFYLKK